MKFSPLLLFLLLLPLAGCGGSALPGCAPAHQTVSLPTRFPQDFPLPSGSVVTNAVQAPQSTTISVLAPTTVSQAAPALIKSLRSKGFRTLSWQITPGSSANGAFTGHAYSGDWTMQSVSGCGGLVRLQVAVQKIKTASP